MGDGLPAEESPRRRALDLGHHHDRARARRTARARAPLVRPALHWSAGRARAASTRSSSPRRDRSARASSERSRRSSARSSSSVHRCTCVARSCTTCTSCASSKRRAPSSSRSSPRCPTVPSSCSRPTASRPKCVAKRAERESLTVIDATCPLVAKVHTEARRYAAQDYNLVLIGHAEHEEVEGTYGEAPERMRIVANVDEVADARLRRERTRRLSDPDHARDRRDGRDRRARCAIATRTSRPRARTTSVTRPRTAKTRFALSRIAATSCWWWVRRTRPTPRASSKSPSAKAVAPSCSKTRPSSSSAGSRACAASASPRGRRFPTYSSTKWSERSRSLGPVHLSEERIVQETVHFALAD